MEEALLKRSAPQSMEAEMSVIGSMLMDKDAISVASEILTKEDFYQRQYGIMFEAIKELYSQDIPVDLVTVQNKLIKDGAPPEMQSLDFLKDIYNTVPTSVNVKAYAEIVYEKSLLRKLIKTAETIVQQCYDGSDETEDILSDTEKSIFELLKTRGRHEYTYRRCCYRSNAEDT